MISATDGLIPFTAASVDTSSELASSIASGDALASARIDTPTLQPPAIDSSAPPCQSLTDPSLLLPKPLSLNGLPLSRSSWAICSPSLRPFGAVQVDWPLITIRYVPLRDVSLSHQTSSRRLGSFGNSTLAISFLPSEASTSVNTMFSGL